MTNTIAYPIRKNPSIRILPQPEEAKRQACRRTRQQQAFWNTVYEAFATIGLITCMILCAVALVCVA